MGRGKEVRNGWIGWGRGRWEETEGQGSPGRVMDGRRGKGRADSSTGDVQVFVQKSFKVSLVISLFLLGVFCYFFISSWVL